MSSLGAGHGPQPHHAVPEGHGVAVQGRLTSDVVGPGIGGAKGVHQLPVHQDGVVDLGPWAVQPRVGDQCAGQGNPPLAARPDLRVQAVRKVDPPDQLVRADGNLGGPAGGGNDPSGVARRTRDDDDKDVPLFKVGRAKPIHGAIGNAAGGGARHADRTAVRQLVGQSVVVQLQCAAQQRLLRVCGECKRGESPEGRDGYGHRLILRGLPPGRYRTSRLVPRRYRTPVSADAYNAFVALRRTGADRTGEATGHGRSRGAGDLDQERTPPIGGVAGAPRGPEDWPGLPARGGSQRHGGDVFAALRGVIADTRAPGASAPELLAIASVPVAALEFASWLNGNGLAGTTAILLVAASVLFTLAARLQRRGRERAGNLLAALVLLALVPMFGVLYAEGHVLAIIAPIAFILLLPHLRGAALVGFGGATLLVCLGTTMYPLLRSRSDWAAPELVSTAVGAVAACGLLLILAWRGYRSGQDAGDRYARLVADLPVGVLRVLPDGILGEANGTLVRMLRFPDRETLLAAPFGEILDHGPEQWRSRLHTSAEGLREGVFKARRYDGTEIWLAVRLRAVLEVDGSLRWLDGTAEDVTAERAEREAQSLVGVITGAAPDAIYGLGMDGRIQSWNAAAARIYGFAGGAVLGRSIFDFAPASQHPVILDLLARARGGQQFGPLDVRQPRRDGAALLLSVTAGPVRDADGQVTGAAVIARDITEHRRLKAEQAGLEDQLRQAQKMEAVGRMAGGIAHDFNNLLTAIAGFGRLVEAGLEGPILDDQRQVLRAADRAADLTRRLLAFSRQGPSSPRPIRLDETIEEAFQMTRRLVPARIDLALDLQGGASVLADPVEIEQVLLNLVVNAIDAIPGSGRIEVTTGVVMLDERAIAGHPGMAPGAHARLVVRDTGTGMDEATRVRIFEPFFTTKGPGVGTGLGLANVYAITRRGGGRVTVESSPGQGTAFTLDLPTADPVTAPAEPSLPSGAGGRERVLVVEDEEAVRLLATRILERAGYQVRAAANPSEALRIATDEVFDALVTDVIMPGMSGPELVAALPAGLPTVFMSGYTGDEARGLGLDRPGRRLVAKPFEAGALTGALREILDGGEVPTAVSAGSAPTVGS